MTGLEKMVGRILEDAKQTADQNLQEAREEAEKIKADSLAQTQSLCDNVARKSELEVQNYLDRTAFLKRLQRPIGQLFRWTMTPILPCWKKCCRSFLCRWQENFAFRKRILRGFRLDLLKKQTQLPKKKAVLYSFQKNRNPLTAGLSLFMAA